MSTDDRERDVVTYVQLILAAFISLTFVGAAFSVEIILIFLILMGLLIFGTNRYSSRKTQAAEPKAYPATSPVYYEEKAPEDAESKTPMLSCPDCGYENPGDADFCIRCGRNLK